MPAISPLLSKKANCMGYRNTHKHGARPLWSSAEASWDAQVLT